jgi:uncharacterized protein YbjT (DUF2867 family)
MTIVALAGASGVVGSRVLEALLARADLARLVALGRRPLSVSHPILQSRVVDLLDPDAVVEALPDATEIALCCLGTTM